MSRLLQKLMNWLLWSRGGQIVQDLGIATVSFAVLNTLIVSILAVVAQNMSSISGMGANFLGLSSMDHGLAMIAGAIVTNVYLRSFGTGWKRNPKKGGGNDGDGEFEA